MSTDKIEAVGWHIGISQQDHLIGLHARRRFTRGESKTVLWRPEASSAEIAAALRELADYVEGDAS